MRGVVIVKAGVTLPSVAARRGDFEDWIAAGLGLASTRIEVVRAFEGAPLPDPVAPAGIVVTGSGAMVTDAEPWSEATAAWLARAVAERTPVLGICYGHQLLARGLGGEVGRNPRGREIGTVEVTLTAAARSDALLAGLSSPLRVQTSHVEAVLGLPPGAVLLGASERDPNHVFRVGDSAWGVQFHPEFDADIVRGYLSERSRILRGEGLDADALAREAADGPDGTSVLRRFAELARF